MVGNTTPKANSGHLLQQGSASPRGIALPRAFGLRRTGKPLCSPEAAVIPAWAPLPLPKQLPGPYTELRGVSDPSLSISESPQPHPQITSRKLREVIKFAMRFWGQLFLLHLKETHQNTTFLNVHLTKPHESGSPATPGLGWAGAARHCPAQDGWKQSQLHQGLNNLFLSLCKHPRTSNGQGWLLQTPPGLGGLQGRSRAGGRS